MTLDTKGLKGSKILFSKNIFARWEFSLIGFIEENIHTSRPEKLHI